MLLALSICVWMWWFGRLKYFPTSSNSADQQSQRSFEFSSFHARQRYIVTKSKTSPLCARQRCIIDLLQIQSLALLCLVLKLCFFLLFICLYGSLKDLRMEDQHLHCRNRDAHLEVTIDKKIILLPNVGLVPIFVSIIMYMPTNLRIENELNRRPFRYGSVYFLTETGCCGPSGSQGWELSAEKQISDFLWCGPDFLKITFRFLCCLSPT